MKKSRFFLVAALLFLALSCGEKNKTPEIPATLTVSPTEISFTADDASNQFLLVKTTEAWTRPPARPELRSR